MWWYWPPCARYGFAAEHTWRAKARPKAAPSPRSLVSEGSGSNRASCSVRAGARAASWGRVTRSWVAAWVTCFSKSSLLPAGLILCHKVQQLRVASWNQDIWWYGRTSRLLPACRTNRHKGSSARRLPGQIYLCWLHGGCTGTHASSRGQGAAAHCTAARFACSTISLTAHLLPCSHE